MGYRKITKVSKNSPQKIDSETVTKENDKEMPKEVPKKKKIYVSRRKTDNYWKFKINYNSLTMDYQKITNLLDNTTNQPTKFRTKNRLK